ncbi:MAG: ABC transporter substrate-binding protein [Peptococcaceae bacterium]|jgi:branched-chain amino acid transport system substrate-binding protein|nr:ABC transporter substrate-binding protein [Peptococcaceae bacterium]
MFMFRSRRRLPVILAVVTALVLVAVLAGCGTSGSTASSVPSQITIGTLYAQSGAFATASMGEYQGLQFWANQVNKNGGVLVKAYNKKIPVKIIAYNDNSDTATAGNLYNQLITQNKVNMLVADFGSVLTSVAVPIAKEHKVLLYDPTGTGASFFTPDNPYLVLTSLPSSGIWPTSLANFLLEKKIGKIAVVYASNDFDQSQAKTLKSILAGGGVTPVYYQAVPTSTKNYGVILSDIAAKKPDAVIEFGYDTNDIAFLQGIRNGGYKFNMVFTVFPGQQLALIDKAVGNAGVAYTYSYPTPPLFGYNNVNYGLGLNAFVKTYEAANNVKNVNFLNIAGYTAGLVIQKSLENAASLKAKDLRAAVNTFSGSMNTLDGAFKIDPATGAQEGELLPVAQFQPSGGTLKPVIVYPANLATGKAVYPAP